MKKIFLHIVFWNCGIDQRNYEIIECIEKNLNLKIFNKINIYLEKDEQLINNLFEKNEYIKIINFTKTPTYQDIFNFSNLMTNDEDIHILANADIFFDETIKLIENMKENEFYGITRYEDNKLFWVKNKQDLISQDFPYSQDVWVWKGANKIKNSFFNLGFPGCDNKIAYFAHTNNYIVKNPCYDIKVHHNHKTNIRNGTSNESNYIETVQLKPTMLIKAGHLNEIKKLGLLLSGEKGLCLVIEQ